MDVLRSGCKCSADYATKSCYKCTKDAEHSQLLIIEGHCWVKDGKDDKLEASKHDEARDQGQCEQQDHLVEL